MQSRFMKKRRAKISRFCPVKENSVPYTYCTLHEILNEMFVLWSLSELAVWTCLNLSEPVWTSCKQDVKVLRTVKGSV